MMREASLDLRLSTGTSQAAFLRPRAPAPLSPAITNGSANPKELSVASTSPPAAAPTRKAAKSAGVLAPCLVGSRFSSKDRRIARWDQSVDARDWKTTTARAPVKNPNTEFVSAAPAMPQDTAAATGSALVIFRTLAFMPFAASFEWLSSSFKRESQLLRARFEKPSLGRRGGGGPCT